MAELRLQPDGDLLLSILKEHDMYLTNIMSLKTFKMGVQELAARQLLIPNGVGQMLELETEYDAAIASFASQVAFAKDDFYKLQEHRVAEARKAKQAAKTSYVDSGNEDEEGLTMEEFEKRVRLRLSFKKASEALKTLESEGLASLNLRLQALTISQNDSFSNRTALMNAKKRAFIDVVVAARAAKEADESAAAAATAAEAAADEQRQLAMALENRAEIDEIQKETENLHDTVRSRIEDEMGLIAASG